MSVLFERILLTVTTLAALSGVAMAIETIIVCQAVL